MKRPAQLAAEDYLHNGFLHLTRALTMISGTAEPDHSSWLFSFACALEAFDKAADIAELLP
jgi:hypothetical protein